MTYLKVQSRRRTLALSSKVLWWYKSQPATESMALALKDLGFRNWRVDMKKAEEATAYFQRHS